MFATHKLALIGILALTAGCDTLSGLADPLRGVETLEDVELASEAEMAQLLTSDVSISDETDVRPNLWNLFRRQPDETVVTAAPLANQEVLEPATGVDVTEVVPEPAEPARSGIFSLFRRSTSTVEEKAEDQTQSDGLARGILAAFTRPSAQVQEPTPDLPLTFGTLRPACEIRNGELGSAIYTVSGFKVYDTTPGATSQRLHYITGFDDGCPREFLGALVLPGDVGTHEIVRYSNTRVQLEYSETDKAYENIKADFCNVSEGQPCGSRLERLGQVTTFVTAYEEFGAGPVWAEFLLHDGKVAAVDLEGQ